MHLHGDFCRYAGAFLCLLIFQPFIVSAAVAHPINLNLKNPD